jgi:hypothetical protein
MASSKQADRNRRRGMMPGPDSSVISRARLCGILYLVVIVTALFAEGFVRSSMIVGNDAATTAANILKSEELYRLGGVADLVNLSCDVGVAVLLYGLLRPYGMTMALAVAAFRIVSDACLGVATFFHFAPLYFLNGAPYLRVFAPSQLQGLAMESLKLHNLGYDISLVFFGVQAVLLGILISRSRVVPRPIGWLFVATGLCYLANSFCHLALPSLNVPIALLLVGFVSENALAWWLLIKGVRVSGQPADAARVAAA